MVTTFFSCLRLHAAENQGEDEDEDEDGEGGEDEDDGEDDDAEMPTAEEEEEEEEEEDTPPRLPAKVRLQWRCPASPDATHANARMLHPSNAII